MQKQLPYERVAISSLKLDPDNARKHDARNIAVIKESLKRFEQQKPIVVTKDNVVIAGNGTLQAAIELGWDTIDITRSQLTGEEAEAYALVDNRTTDLSQYDDEILKEKLQRLEDAGWDIPGLGWDSADIALLTDPFIVDDKDDEEKEKSLLLKVETETEAELEDLFVELRDRGFKVKL